MVNNVLWEVDRTEVERIPVGFGHGYDRLIWHYTPNGEYSVKSGYHLTQETDVSTSNGSYCGLTKGLCKMWSLKIPNKIKIHFWRLLLKVNDDAAIFVSNNRFGIGIVGRDNNGHILFAEGRILKGRFSPHMTEIKL